MDDMMTENKNTTNVIKLNFYMRSYKKHFKHVFKMAVLDHSAFCFRFKNYSNCIWCTL